MHHLTRTVKGVLQSMILVPLMQGVVAFFGFWALGVPAPLLWSAMVVFAALIPLVGSPLAWIPASLYLFLAVSPTRGVLMALYGTFAISMVDNLLKPLILKGAAQIHTMLGFLSIMGGLVAFGPKGLIVGPVVLSLVLSAYRIYRYDILRWREEEGMGATIMDWSTPFTVRVRWCIASVSWPRVRGEIPRNTSRRSSESRRRKNSIIRNRVASTTAVARPASATWR